MRALSTLGVAVLLVVSGSSFAATQNRAPVMNTPTEIPLEVGQDLSLDVSAFDPDGDPITLRAENLPGNATFEDLGDGAGVINFIPSAEDIGRNEITIFAADNQGGESFSVVALDVLAPPPPPVDEVVIESCAVAPASSSASWLALGALLALLWTRRRAAR
jgi:MYXO-CTERM domain-containing protein